MNRKGIHIRNWAEGMGRFSKKDYVPLSERKDCKHVKVEVLKPFTPKPLHELKR